MQGFQPTTEMIDGAKMAQIVGKISTKMRLSATAAPTATRTTLYHYHSGGSQRQRVGIPSRAAAAEPSTSAVHQSTASISRGLCTNNSGIYLSLLIILLGSSPYIYRDDCWLIIELTKLEPRSIINCNCILYLLHQLSLQLLERLSINWQSQLFDN